VRITEKTPLILIMLIVVAGTSLLLVVMVRPVLVAVARPVLVVVTGSVPTA